MPAADRLLPNIHPALSTDPEATDVIRLSPTTDCTITITTDTLTVYLPLTQQRYTLGDRSIARLLSDLPATVGATLLQSDWASVGAISLQPQEISLIAGGSGVLSAYTAGVWRTVRPLGAGLDALTARVESLVAQLDLARASGPWLDLWGMVWQMPRIADEPDSAYQQRIIYALTLPRANNRALEALILQALGRSATVSDGGGSGLFTWNGGATGNTWGPTGTAILGPQQYGSFLVTMDAAYNEDVSALLAIIATYKAAGTTFTLNTRDVREATLGYGDVIAS